MNKGGIRIGISGWRYEPWRGAFYPKGLAQHRELAFASRALTTIEINGSFYSLQRPESWGSWFDDTPEDFVFSVKCPRFITHIKRLREIEAPMANFFASGVLRLKQKLGPLLWQFPPNFRFDPASFEPFLATLPFDTEHALWLARQHDARLDGRAWLHIDVKRPLRHAVEVRHESFVDDAFIELLRHYDVAFVVADTPEPWPKKDDLSADFVYMRLHGSTTLYQSAYSDEELDQWAQRIRCWSAGKQVDDARLISRRPAPRRGRRDVFCYFDNTDKLHAPVDAKRLLRKLALACAAAVAVPWALLPQPVQAQTDVKAELAHCASIGPAEDRLACYDHVAGRAHQAVSGPVAPPESKPKPGAAGSLLSRYWELDPADKRGIFNFTGYRPNYILPLHLTSDINRAPRSPTQAAVLLPDYKHLESKIQLSLRTKLAQGLVLPDGDLWAGYTQQSLWQVWNNADSKPFRNTDYEAELMYVLPIPGSLRGLPFGWQWRYGQLGLAHQSNGQADPLSRSWNRVYFGAGIERGNMALTTRIARRLREAPDDDNNPDFTDYRGRGDLQLTWTQGLTTGSVLYRTNFKDLRRGALQFEWTYPVYAEQPNGLRWFVQIFTGYGETMTDYNFHQTSVGAGLTFLQF